MKTFGDVLHDVVFAGSSVRIVPIGDLFVPFLVLSLDLVADFLLNDVGKVGGSAEFSDIEFKHLREHLDAERSMCGIVTTFINVTLDYGRGHPVIRKDEVYPALLCSVVGVTGGTSRSALTY